MDQTSIDRTLIWRRLTARAAVPRHILSVLDFDRDMIEACFGIAAAIEGANPDAYANLVRGQCMAVMFYQQSTRTRLNFESAMLRLGGRAIGFADSATTRAVGFYQETLEDVVRFTAQLADLLVLRHTETGAAHRAAALSPVPVINAGDGYGEHPTQALGDLYHLHKHFGRIDGLTVGLVGHLGWRGHRAFALALSRFDVKFVILPAPDLTPPPEIIGTLEEHGVRIRFVDNLQQVLAESDVVSTLGAYQTDFKVPFGDKQLREMTQPPTPPHFRITAEALKEAGRFVPVMHIGPISDTIDRSIDDTPYAHYFAQARDGLWMRMSILGALLTSHGSQEHEVEGRKC